MVVLIDEILREILVQLGHTASASEDSKKESKKDNGNDLANFMLSGKESSNVAFKFLEAAKKAILDDEDIELLTDKEERAKFKVADLTSVEAVMKILQKSIKKLECKKFNEKQVPFWKAVKSNVNELELSDFNFDNEKYNEVVKDMDSLEKATIQLDIYCIGFMDGISLTCKELVLKGEAFDQIENGEDLNIKLPSVKKLTVIGRYVGWGPTDMSLESLIKNLKAICPGLEELALFVDDDNVDTEVPQTFIDLISKPEIDEKLDIKVVFNFTLNESSWQKSNFHQELQKHPDIELVGEKDGSKSKVKLGEKKLIEFNLSSEMTEEDDDNEKDDDEKNDADEDKGEEEDSTDEPATKKMKS